METIDLLEKVLKNLKSTGGIEAVAIVSRDGLLIKGEIPASIASESFVAMTAAMLGAAETASAELHKGIPERVIVETDSGKIITVGAGLKTLLAVVAAPNAGLGLILLNMQKAALKVKETLE